ncbi:phosphoribosylformylglycinamidine synthase subunit PurQ [Candidatus Woesearchaeota archaeon]|nr:phosphoribosylformylglycinamidine synthase subunit PurQ [Candidatus Woesearchaeota archaeon]
MDKPKPRVLILSGYGINCEEETLHAFERAGATGNIVHINDLISGDDRLGNYQILAFPGGFSYGDDLGSGRAFASRVKHNLWEELLGFVYREDTLGIGICNGCQIMSGLGIVPALEYNHEQQVSFTHNSGARYLDRWVDLQMQGNSPWVRGIGEISMPIAHAEGRFVTDTDTLARLKELGLIAATYVEGDMCANQDLPANPNGSLDNVAGITDESGRFLAMMPHPERAIRFTQRPNWPLLREQMRRRGEDMPAEGPGMALFRNAVAYYD